MRTWITGRVTYANVAATLALVLALSGTAYAAGVAKNSVGSPQIKNESIKSVDVKNNALKGSDIKEGSLARVPDAAALGGVGAGSYHRSGGTATGAFDAVLTVTISGYGTYGLRCDADDELRWEYSGAALGANFRQFISMDWSDGPYTATETNTQMFGWDGTGSGSGTSVDSGKRFHVRTYLQNATGSKRLIVEGWGTTEGSGCWGHVETWIVQ